MPHEARAHVVFRADAGASVGGGHVLRCLALAQQAKLHGADATFVLGVDGSSFALRLEREGMRVVTTTAPVGSRDDGAETARVARDVRATLAIVDGYRFADEPFRSLRAASVRTAVIDDDLRHRDANVDAIVNPNAYARADDDAQRVMLAGARYALLRREIVESAHEKTRASTLRVLITCGAADPTDATRVCLDALADAQLRDVDVRVVVGAAHPNPDAIAARASSITSRIEVVRDVADMSALYAWADVAVAAAGGTAWELCFFGVPFVALAVAPNQERVRDAVTHANAAIGSDVDAASIARALATLANDDALRARMAASGRALVDGQGAGRCMQALLGWPLRLRLATMNDADFILALANEPTTRAMSFQPAAIARDDHIRWLTARLAPAARDAHTILIAHDADDVAVGQIRFHRVDGTVDEDEVGLSIAAEARGRGLGRALLRLGVAQARARRHTKRVHARVKPENATSLALFRGAGFIEQPSSSSSSSSSSDVVHFVLEADA